METKFRLQARAPGATRVIRILAAGLAALTLSSCGGGGGDDASCSPPPQINSTPPLTATAGSDYRYHVDAAYSCLGFFFLPIPAICRTVSPIQLPAGADLAGNTIVWTPPASLANSDVRFAVATEPDLCGDRATQAWTVRVHAAPVMESFTAAKSTVAPGESTTLTAVFQDSGWIDNLGSVTSGVPVATPPLSTGTSFTLVVTNGGARVQQTISIGMLTTVTATNPVNGATGVPVNRALTATFSKPMNGATISSSTF